MKVFVFIFMVHFTSSSLPLINSEPQLVFSIYRKDIHIVNLDKLNSTSSISYKDTDLFINTTGVKNYITELDYNIRANIFIWRKTEPENALYVTPIDKSRNNLLGIRDKKLLLKLNKSFSMRISIDWIHDLVYYNEYDSIIAFNMTYPEYGFVVISDTKNKILDICVNPLDSYIFWSSYDNNKRSRIIRASQDGSNEVILIDRGIKEPTALAIDLVLRRVFWIDRLSFKFSSMDFDGKNVKTILQSPELFTLTNFMEIFGDHIYWSNYYHFSILKTNKFGLNGTQINYLVKGEIDSEIESIKIIDSSLQPNATNRCIHAKCTHLCIPINANQYRCVCPHLIYNVRYYRRQCTESTHTIETIEDNEKETTHVSKMSTTLTTINDFSSSTLEEVSYPQMTVISSTPQSLSSDSATDENTERLTLTNQMMNAYNCLTNSSRFQKTFYIKNYQTSSVLYVLLVISIIFNIILSFAFIFRLYRRKKSQRNTRIRAQRHLAQFKTNQIEITNNENIHLIQSNPLISNTVFMKKDLYLESNLDSH